MFTASKSIILYKIGQIQAHKFQEVRNMIVSLLDTRNKSFPQPVLSLIQPSLT